MPSPVVLNNFPHSYVKYKRLGLTTLNNLVGEIRSNIFLACYKIAVPEAVIPQLVKENDAMVLSWRQQMDCNTSVYQGHLRQ